MLQVYHSLKVLAPNIILGIKMDFLLFINKIDYYRVYYDL